MNHELSEEQIRYYQENGFVVVEGFLQADQSGIGAKPW